MSYIKEFGEFILGLYAAYEIKIIIVCGLAGGLIAKALGGAKNGGGSSAGSSGGAGITRIKELGVV